MRSRRALLYMPGDDRRKIEKAATLGVDSICMDLEDGTAVSRKAEARTVIARALGEVSFGNSERCIRINGIGTGFEQEDLAAALDARPDTIILPKVESAEQVQGVSGQIGSYEASHGLPPAEIRLLIGVETALGIMNLKEIARADERLDAIIFGAEDFAASVGATRSPGSWEVFVARSAVVTACAAYGLQAIDMVCIDFKDLAHLKAESKLGAAMGFHGKQIIHPNQVQTVQEAFTPGDESIAHAKQLVETFEACQREGKGAYAVEGRMIDLPLVKNAEKVLARARAAGRA